MLQNFYIYEKNICALLYSTKVLISEHKINLHCHSAVIHAHLFIFSKCTSAKSGEQTSIIINNNKIFNIEQ